MPIEKLSPALDDIIETESVHLIDSQGFSFGGAEGPAEGPLWWSDLSEGYGGHLLFSDIHNDRRMRFTIDGGIAEDGLKDKGLLAVEAEPVNRHNGLTRDLQGRLIAAEHDGRRISRLEHDGSHHCASKPVSGPPAQPPERRGGKVRRQHLFHRSVDISAATRAVGADHLRRLPVIC